MTSQFAPMCVMFTSSDMQRSVAFYRDKLGFTMKESWPDEKSPQWCNMVLETQSVMLGQAAAPEKVGEYCKGDAKAEALWKKQATAYQKNAHGVGVAVYVSVPDVDGYCARIAKKGITVDTDPKTQFYGIRDFAVTDPDGYCLVFYTTVTLSSCGSCGMPLTEAKPGQMYCQYCTDESGKLRPYETVFEGTVTGYYMQMQKMPRAQAEKAAREHLAKMPAWSAHK